MEMLPTQKTEFVGYQVISDPSATSTLSESNGNGTGTSPNSHIKEPTATLPSSNNDDGTINSNNTNDDEEEELKAATLIYDGFSSSVCDMHADREDCCAVAWFGACLRGRNNFLLHKDDMNYAPMPHWKIFVTYILPFVTYVILIAYFVTSNLVKVDQYGNETPYDPDAEENDDANEGDDGSTIQISEEGNVRILVTTVIYIVYYYFTRRSIRTMDRANRNQLRDRMKRKLGRPLGTRVSTDMARSRFQICGCTAYKFEQEEYQALQQSRADRADFCTKLWHAASELCMGALCRCWCLWCGVCALAQENRQLKKLLPASAFDIDFVTYQSWEDYVPALVSLRNRKDGSLTSHYSSLSDLSKLLLQYSSAIFGLCALFAFSNMFDSFTWPNLIVLFMTLVQAFSILFVCHWLYNRFDLSLDAVIKFFASGFVYSVFLALIFEMLVGFALKICQVLLTFAALFAAVFFGYNRGNEEAEEAEVTTIEEVIGGFFVFLNAFIVAATTEELCKYFCYSIVRHYDLEQRPYLASNNMNCKYGEHAAQTAQSRGCAITVAMVTTALGFACCENLLYVFGYSGGGLENEISTLVMRMLFPLHPIAAAIQSIGVVRKTIEGEVSLGIGKIILPAIILHGSFDFALMLLAYLAASNNEENQNENKGSGDEEEDESQQVVMLAMSLGFSVIVMISGLVYYFRTAREQRKRLQRIDEGDNCPIVVEGIII